MKEAVNTMETVPTTHQPQKTYSHFLEKEIKAFDLWIKNMNYKLFLEHAHSTEYYARNQFYLNHFGGLLQ